MKYLCLIYEDEKKVATMAKSEADAFTGEYFAFTDGARRAPPTPTGPRSSACTTSCCGSTRLRWWS